MKILTESEILNLFREEQALKNKALVKEVDMYFKNAANKDELTIVSPDLKVKHKKSGYRYTVDSVSARDVTLKTPEGELFDVDQKSLESEYELD
jgi:fibrillarin-like rRNA methylase